MRRSIAVLLLAALAVLAVAAACATDPAGTGDYQTYRQLEDARNTAENDLRQAFADINDAAVAKDRDGVSAAANDGLEAVDAIDAALVAEIDAARELQQVEKLAAEARKMEQGLLDSRSSLDYFRQQLQIALEDPFLETKGNVEKVGELAKTGADLAVKGELAVRKADREIAEALGLEPRRDQVLDNPTTTGQ
jgi:hypothetical protein